MNLIFTSNIKQNKKKTKISFESKVYINKYKQFTVYEFTDPKSNVLNRIEVANGEVNIFIGTSSMNLILNNWIKTSYNTPHGEITLESYLIRLDQSKNKVEFKYKLKNDNKNLGTYNLKLEISEI